LTAGLDIRRIRELAELAACAALYERVLRETFTWTDPETHQARDFLRAARDEEVYAAFEDGRLLGVAAFYRPANFLHSLYVIERGRGIGKALLDHVSAVADGPISLKVQTLNLRAQDFYRREGFRLLDEGRDVPSGVAWRRLVRIMSPS
jgi:ribosomal protein S18 acetylase RimI-like enzyme